VLAVSRHTFADCSLTHLVPARRKARSKLLNRVSDLAFAGWAILGLNQ
jgi:hypothetical protein